MSYQKDRPSTIQAMFGSIAKNYDRTNALVSFGLHRLWNRALIKKALAPYSPASFLDLCCGTGEIALSYLKHSTTPCKAYLLDFCPEMLEIAKQKSIQLSSHTLQFIEADAQKIPLATSSIQCATIAYGIRNVQDPEACLKEVYRVLDADGVLGVLELTEPSNPLLKKGHQLYLRHFLPLVGSFSTSNRAAYQYLSQSIQKFTKPAEFVQLLKAVGFQEVEVHSLNFGAATIFIAKKNSPLHSPN